jgi:hypothetical protein
MSTSFKSQDVLSPHFSATIQPKLLDMFMKTMKLNVSQCAEATPPLPPPLPADGKAPTPPPTPDAAAASDSIATAARAVSGFSNPGPYEQAINDVKRIVMVDTFEGFRCDISKQVVRKCVVGMLVPTWPCRCNQKMCIVQTSMVSFPNKYRHCLFLVSINVPNFRLYTPMLWDNWG